MYKQQQTSLWSADHSYFFLLVLIVHAALWTLIPSITASNMPLDAIESGYWAKELQTGYFKHPPLNAWLMELVIWLFGRHDSVIFALSQLCNFLAILPIVLIIRERAGNKAASYAALCITGTLYASLSSFEYNVNMSFIPFWGWCIYVFLRAEKSGALKWWIALGLLAGAGFLAKYSIGLLLLTFALWVVLKRRDLLLTWGAYLSGIIFVVIISPHILWLIENDFPTLTYLSERAASDVKSWSNHLTSPLRYCLAFVSNLLPLLIILFIAGRGRVPLARHWSSIKRALTAIGKDTLVFITLTPIAILALGAFVTGAKIQAMWSIPLGLMLAGLIGSGVANYDGAAFRSKFISAWAVLTLFLVMLFALAVTFSSSLRSHPLRVAHDGEALSSTAMEYWYRYNEQAPVYVLGDQWTAGTVIWYSEARPSMFEHGDLKRSPWVDIEKANALSVLYASNRSPEQGKKIAGMCANHIRSLPWPMPRGAIYKKPRVVWLAILNTSFCEDVKE